MPLNNSTQLAATLDDATLAKQQLRIKEMERKATFESTQGEMRHQKDILKSLRRENKELRATMSQSAKGAPSTTSMFSGSSFHEKEASTLQSKVFALRRQLDSLKSSNDRKAADLAKMNERAVDLLKEGQPILADNSPLTQKIRLLENRLDKSLIKHNEAMSIRRTYEQIVKRLKEERVGFDNQLAAIEKTLKAKEHDFLELLNMSHDAHHAKEIARAEVQQFRTAYSDERRQKKKDLEERKAFVQSKMDQTAKQEKAMKAKRVAEEQQGNAKQEEDERRRREQMHSTAELRTEEEQERLTQYAEAYRKIKDVTRAATVDEVIAKFIAQEATHRTLVDMTRDVQAKIDALHTQRAELRRKAEDSKYSGSGQLGSRRIVDEFETHLSESKIQLEKAQKNFEHTSHLFIAVKAGVEHLADKLSTYRPEMQAPAISDENIIEVLKHGEQKLQMLVDEAVTTEPLEDVLAHAQVEMPQNNIRVKLATELEDEEEERAKAEGLKEEDTEDDPHDRVALKQMSISAVERETKKARKRGRKKEDGDV